MRAIDNISDELKGQIRKEKPYMSVRLLSEKYGIAKHVITEICKGIKFKTKYNPETVKAMYSDYQTMTAQEVSKKYNCNETYVIQFCGRKTLPPPEKEINHTGFFDYSQLGMPFAF